MARKILMKLLLLSLLLTAISVTAMAASDTVPPVDELVSPDTDIVQGEATPVPTEAVEEKVAAVRERAPVVEPTDIVADPTADPTVQPTNIVAPELTPWVAAGMTEEEYNLQVENARFVNGKVTGPSGRIVHYTLYMSDGYINRDLGTLSGTDATSIAGWPFPVYIWGFSDIDPDIPGNNFTVPAGAYGSLGNTLPAPVGTIDRNTGLPGTVASGIVGNAQFPAPYLEANVGDDVYATLINRGMYQNLQSVEDDHSIHWHGIHAQSQYDGFPETAGGYTEQLRYFWEEPWYLALGATTKDRDTAWNAMDPTTQQNYLRTNTPLIRTNHLNAGGAVLNKLNTAPFPDGIGGLTPQQVEEETQFTYYWRAQAAGTYMYHCHVAAHEHVQQGMYGALVIHPATGTDSTVYGVGTNSDYTVGKDYTFLLSEIDPVWHSTIESGTNVGFDPTLWRPQLWFTNGRTFPMTIFPHAENNPAGGTIAIPKYNTYIKVGVGEKFLTRYINMGFQGHSPHQHGWHYTVVGTDATPLGAQYGKNTLNIGSGETYDTITTADPVYGVNYPAGSPLAAQNSPRGSLNFRQVYPMHDHYDYQVTTNGIYPGGGAILIEATDSVGSAIGVNPTFLNPYSGLIEPLPIV